MTDHRKKLIEVALPLEAINEGSKPETENPFLKGHPRALHNWWARTPLSVCRAVIFSQLVDDPDDDETRQEIVALVRRLAQWNAVREPAIVSEAREWIERSTGSGLSFFDPFAGRGSIPLEAQRLGLDVTSSDLNPVAVLINKILLEVVPRFSSSPPVSFQKETELVDRDWQSAQGLAADVQNYGLWMRDEAEKRLGYLYPKVKLSSAQGGAEVPVFAWLWARTVKCPNPACRAQMPLVSSFWLSKKKGKLAWIEPVIDAQTKTVSYTVRTGEGQPPDPPKIGRGAKFKCLVCEHIAEEQHIRDEGAAGRMGVQLMVIVAEGDRQRVYLEAIPNHADVAQSAKPTWLPVGDLPDNPRWFSPPLYGVSAYADLFTPRQVVMLATLCDLVPEVREKAEADALRAGMADDGIGIKEGGKGARAYADAIASICACAVSRASDYWNSLATWNTTNENVRNLFQRQAIPMAWDFAEPKQPAYKRAACAGAAIGCDVRSA